MKNTKTDQYKLATLLLLTFFLFLIPGKGEAQNERVVYYENMINEVISGYDSKDFDTYDKAQYNITSFLSTSTYWEIMMDSLVPENEKLRLLNKIENAYNTWFCEEKGKYILVYYRALDEGVIDAPVVLTYITHENGNATLYVGSEYMSFIKNVHAIAFEWKDVGEPENTYIIRLSRVDEKYFKVELTPDIQRDFFSRTLFCVYLTGESADEVFNSLLRKTQALKEQIEKDKSNQNKF